MNDFEEPWGDFNIIGENDPNRNDYEPARSPGDDLYYTLFDEDDDRPFYELGTYVVDEEDLPPEQPTYHFCTEDYNEVNAGLILLEEDEVDEEPVYHEEKPDINLIYGLYEESEFY